MIPIKKWSIVIFLFTTCFILNTKGQATYSPYSMLGLGEIENKDYGRTAGMSNLGIGIRSSNYLNLTNSAGLSGLDSLKLLFDFSFIGKQTLFMRNESNESTFNGNIKMLSMGFRLAPGWGVALGTKPFSDVGYQIYSEEPIEGSTETKTIYLEGTGGLYELFLSNGIRITDNFSAGINTKYVLGTIRHNENQSGFILEKESRVSQFYNTFGLQYHRQGFTAGATYGYKQDIDVKNKTIIYDEDSNVIEEVKARSVDQFIPETWGVGFTHDRNKIIWGMDFKYQKWDGIDSGISSVKIIDSYWVNAGLGFTPNIDSYYKHQGQIQIGTSLSKSYIQIGGENAYNYSVSIGYSWPVYKNYLNLALEYGNSLSAPKNYIKESYVMVTINYSAIEQLFGRARFR